MSEFEFSVHTAISRPLPGKPFPNEWDFCVEACVLQDRDRFVFGDFVVVIAAFFDGLDECFEFFLRDPGAQDHRFRLQNSLSHHSRKR
jgi:hypothetical protein